MSLVQDARNAHALHGFKAWQLYQTYKTWWSGPVPRGPGMDTITRLALRLYYGRTPAEALAREYLYRWGLAIKPADQCIGAATRNPCVSIFGAPHTIGM
jgi:hypothetical protein